MSLAWRAILGALAAPALFFLGCGNDAPAGPDTGTVVVTGTVVEFQDSTPVDGGVTIAVTTRAEETQRLYLPPFAESLTPPSLQTINLYDLVRRVELGDLIRAEGKPTSMGVELQSLAILSGRP